MSSCQDQDARLIARSRGGALQREYHINRWQTSKGAEMSMTILYVCDNRDEPSWGGRANSIALGQHLVSHGDLISIGRSWAITPIPIGNLVEPIHRNHYGGKVVRRALRKRSGRRALRVLNNYADYVELEPRRSVARFEKAARTDPSLSWLRDQFEAADVVVINGEGSLVFREKLGRDVRFQLLAVELAADRGKPVGYINALASNCPSTQAAAPVQQAVRRSLERCNAVVVRDPMSRQRLRDLGLSRVGLAPDAVFTWASRYGPFLDGPLGRERPELFDSWPESDRFLRTPSAWPDNYVCVGGASRYPGQDLSHWPDFFEALVRRLETVIGLPVVVIDSGGDSFLERVARRTRSLLIRPPVNLLMALYALANARAFVSGRFHPSVMASLGGTPCTFLECQAHKTLSIQQQLEYSEPKVFPIAPSEGNLAAIVRDVEEQLAGGQLVRNQIRRTALRLAEEATQEIHNTVSGLCGNAGPSR